jgi:L-asparagine transporter-like permease
MVYFVLASLGEMSTLIPTSGSFPEFVSCLRDELKIPVSDYILKPSFANI